MPGSVKRRGKRWHARIDVGKDANGKRIQRSRSFDTKKEGQDWITKQRHELRTGTYLEPSDQPFSELLWEWLDTKTDLAESSLHLYTLAIRSHLIPALGDRPLNSLTHADIQRTYNTTGGRMITQVMHMVASQALNWAVRIGRLAKNPAEHAVIPRRHDSDEQDTPPPAWSADELSAFLRWSEVHTPWYYPLFQTLASTGMRSGEVRALTWDKIDLNRLQITVSATISKAADGRAQLVERLKHPRQRRTLAIDELTARVLGERWRESRGAQQVRPEWNTRGLCFPGINNGDIMSNVSLQNNLNAGITALGLRPITVHGLRHTHATLLLGAGRPPHYVARRLGHSSPQITMGVYAHVLPGTDTEDAAVFASLLESAGEQSVNNREQTS